MVSSVGSTGSSIYGGYFNPNYDGIALTKGNVTPYQMDLSQVSTSIVSGPIPISALSQANNANAAGVSAKNSLTSIQSAASLNAPASTGVSTYDFTNMTPDQIKGIAQNLYKSGKIDLTQEFRLQQIGIPLGKLGPDGQYRLLTDAEKAAYSSKPVNYIQSLKDQMAFLEQKGEASDPKFGYADLQKMLATLEDLQGKTSGVNITA